MIIWKLQKELKKNMKQMKLQIKIILIKCDELISFKNYSTKLLTQKPKKTIYNQLKQDNDKPY